MHVPLESELNDDLEVDLDFHLEESLALVLECTKCLTEISNMQTCAMNLDALHTLKQALEHLDHLFNDTTMLKLRSAHQLMLQKKSRMTLETRCTMLSEAIDQLGKYIRDWNTTSIKHSIEVNCKLGNNSQQAVHTLLKSLTSSVPPAGNLERQRVLFHSEINNLTHKIIDLFSSEYIFPFLH
jgi:hypothetical protein